MRGQSTWDNSTSKLRTKYINGKYWHLGQEKISIHAVSMKDQKADLLTDGKDTVNVCA